MIVNNGLFLMIREYQTPPPSTLSRPLYLVACACPFVVVVTPSSSIVSDISGLGSCKIVHKYQNKLLLKPDFPSLADEIAEPRPDVNIKVAAFTVSEKSINANFTRTIQ